MAANTGRSKRSSEDYLTLDEVCAVIKITRSTFYDWRQKGTAPRCRRLPNGRLRIRRDHFESWLDDLEDAA